MARVLPPARIEYKSYVLRPVEPSDVPQIQETVVATLPTLRQFMAWSHLQFSQQQFLERVLQQHANYFKGVDYELALFDKTSGEFILYTGFYPSNRINPKAMEVGYWVSAKHQGKGLATLATQIQIAVLFEYFKCERVEITCHVENKASLRVIEKCGFQYEGELRSFYPKPTPEMLQNGFVETREAKLFALIEEDRPHLPWYSNILVNTILFPLLRTPLALAQMSENN